MADNIGHKTTGEYKQSNNNNNKQHRTGNLKDEQHGLTKNPRINPGTREG